MGWISAWRGAPAVDERRWVVLDVEASGLDAAHDRLLAIASVAVRVDWGARALVVDLGDSFEAVLRQEQPSSRDNILLHGIGVARQSGGLPMAQGLQAFASHAGHSPLLAFHVAFDRTLVQRHAQASLGRALSQPWVDIEHLCGVTHPEVPARSLDEWMAHFGIRCAARHQAAADALAECELLLRVWPRVAAECRCWRDVQRLAQRRRWIARG
ncbi:3'-5' exonuclease [Ramlibacter tataouinensis]|uniref:3'-5' exonuclease n=1 Tax=Ramlibacter tataouinensis TaxID=94132 RepID=UPI0022F3924E|nr:3'-5' exonuclease [Ramlibacter tataouinensis]WBY01695.1 3'-5' exonuclease [Ramlibacter tataouinensis]